MIQRLLILCYEGVISFPSTDRSYFYSDQYLSKRFVQIKDDRGLAALLEGDRDLEDAVLARKGF